MKKLLCLLPVSLLLCSCGKSGAIVAAHAFRVAGRTETGKIIIVAILYELFTTVLPLFLAMLVQLPDKVKDNFEESSKEFGFWAGLAGVLSFITYFTSDAISGLIAIAILAGVPALMRTGYKVSWGRAFGTLGLFILFSIITELIVEAIFG